MTKRAIKVFIPSGMQMLTKAVFLMRAKIEFTVSFKGYLHYKTTLQTPDSRYEKKILKMST